MWFRCYCISYLCCSRKNCIKKKYYFQGAKNKSVYDGSWTEYGDEKLKNEIEK